MGTPRYFLLLLILLLPLFGLKAQKPVAYARFDSADMLVGGRRNLTINVNIPLGAEVSFPYLDNYIRTPLEILEKSAIDTLKFERSLSFKQTLTITSFDTGKYSIAPISFNYHHKNDTVENILLTDSIHINVKLAEADTTKAFVDIKAPIDTPFVYTELLVYAFPALIAALFILLLLLVYIYFKRAPDKPASAKPKTAPRQDPPHVYALKELDKIKKGKLLEQGKVKLYHSEITDTIRRYIEGTFKIMAMEQTSDEILESLNKKQKLNEKDFKALESILKLSDIVKFAKYKPTDGENSDSLNRAYSFVNDTKTQNDAQKTNSGKK